MLVWVLLQSIHGGHQPSVGLFETVTGHHRLRSLQSSRCASVQDCPYSSLVNVEDHSLYGSSKYARCIRTSASPAALTCLSHCIRNQKISPESNKTKSSIPRASSPPVEATSNHGLVQSLPSATTHAGSTSHCSNRAYASTCARFRHARTPAAAFTLHVYPPHHPAELLGLHDTQATQDPLRAT